MHQSSHPGGYLLAAARVAWGAATLAAIVATFVDTASGGPVNPFNFFGYFTIQSNSLLVAVAIGAGLLGLLRPGPQPRWLVVSRSLATTCMVIVGLVYAVLLAPLGAAGGVPVAWANWVMHVAGPVLVALDWVIARDRGPLPWRIAWWQLAYPVVWTAVVLVRGATDGWVPYPFLNPQQGYATVLLYVVVIAAVFAVVSFTVVWWSRRWNRGLRG
ncbi:membrane protein [Leucobacter sp. UCD-THU]|uniref:Pr6Pr family membrane protein n=1 Tax=Leucobacter sp. UCD-THU TaxID=1292023 RepID=UPI0003660754|nr:Pr6Pr family membrane protein [Leucobacter sp. UCD-THU]EYT56470.1 membrane protein [Leucobacter sp. UCD-THU]